MGLTRSNMVTSGGGDTSRKNAEDLGVSFGQQGGGASEY